MRRVERHQLLGTYCDAFTVADLLVWIDATVASADAPAVIAGHNVNSLTLLQANDDFRRFYEMVDCIYVDGMPVIGIARLLGLPLRRFHRLGVLDWIWPLLGNAEESGWHVAHLGGTDALNERAALAIEAVNPRMRLTTINGYFDPVKGSVGSKDVVEQLWRLQPDIVLVGMGMPRQETWLADHLDELPAAVYITVGGLLGYIAGDRRTAPRWTGQVGLEWAFRLATEPRRLARRYLVEPLALVPLVARAVVDARLRER